MTKHYTSLNLSSILKYLLEISDWRKLVSVIAFGNLCYFHLIAYQKRRDVIESLEIVYDCNSLNRKKLDWLIIYNDKLTGLQV
jgi:hypothetical protein